MSTTIQVPTRTTPSAQTPTAQRQPVWKHGVVAAAAASVATTVLAAVASAARLAPRERPIARLLWQVVVSAGCRSWWG